jgi:hypothetical protein
MKPMIFSFENILNIIYAIEILTNIYNLKYDRLQHIKNNSICEYLDNNFTINKKFYIFENANDTHEKCSFRVIDLLDMNVEFNYIYTSNNTKLAFQSVNDNELVCGKKMIQTNTKYYLLEYQESNQIQNFFQESKNIMDHGEPKEFEELKKLFKKEIKEDCKIIKTFDNFGLWLLLIILLICLLFVIIILSSVLCFCGIMFKMRLKKKTKISRKANSKRDWLV